MFHLSSNDLVYVPTHEEIENQALFDFKSLTKVQVNQIYKCLSFTRNQSFFLNSHVVTSMVNKIEYSALNKMEYSIEGIQIKSCCLKLEIDRLGNILNEIK